MSPNVTPWQGLSERQDVVPLILQKVHSYSVGAHDNQVMSEQGSQDWTAAPGPSAGNDQR